MIFPIGDDQVKGGNKPIFSYSFIAINVAIFVYQLSNLAFTYGFSTVPYEILNGVDLVIETDGVPQSPGPFPIYLTMISSMFMHGGWMHLIGNMVFLWVFGDNIESAIGSVKFLAFYILGGIVASATHILTNSASVVPSLGASGAIAAVLGAYLVMFPQSRIKMLILIFFRTFRIPAFVFLGFWIIQNLFSGIGSLGVTGTGSGVAWWSHIGGFVFGVIAGFFFKNQNPKVLLEGHEYKTIKRPAVRYNNRFITDRYE